AHLSRQLNQAIKLLRDEQDNGTLRRCSRPLPPPKAEAKRSFGTSTPKTTERSSFGNRAEGVIAQRLREMAEQDRRGSGVVEQPVLIAGAGRNGCSTTEGQGSAKE